MGKALIWGCGVVLLAVACGSDSEPSADGAGMSGGGGAGTGASGGTATAGSGAAGSGGTGDSTCIPLPGATGTTVTVSPSDAGSLDGLVYDAEPGTTFLLEPGTYQISAGLQMHAEGVSLRSTTDDAEDVTIDGDYSVNELIAISASNVTVAHVTLTHAVDHLIHIYPPASGGIVSGATLYGLRFIDSGEQFLKVNPNTDLTGYVDDGVVECSLFQMTDAGRPHVEDLDGSSCYTGGIDMHAAWGWEIRANRFEGIYCETGLLAEHAIHLWTGSRDTLVENNLIMNCARGIGFGLGERGSDRVYDDQPYGGASLGHYDGVIRNNVIWADIPWYDTGIELHLVREPRVVHNTVVSGSGATGFFRSIDYRYAETQVFLANNLTRSLGPRDGAQATLESNLEDTPLSYFVDPPGGDFHLTADATDAIDQAAVLDDAGVDLDGDPHNSGSGPDLGADERP